MNTALGVGLICGAALLPRLPDRVVSARGLGIFTALVGVGIFLYVGSTNLRYIAVGAFFLGAFLGGMEPLLRTLLHIDSPHEYVGRVVGTAQWHRSAGELLPLAFVPALAAVIGIQQTLLAGGVVVVLAALAGLKSAGRIDRARAEGRNLPS
jgi:MFS family permease